MKLYYMQLLRLGLFLFVATFLLPSCIKDVILDAGEESKVVVECVLTDSETQELHLNFTKGASKAVAEPLTEAVATLIDLTESKVVGQFVKAGEGDLWTLDYQTIPQHSYRLEVQVSGHDLVYGEDTMPNDINIYSFTYTENILDNVGGVGVPYPSFSNSAFCAGTVYLFNSLPEHTLIYGMNYNRQTGRHEIADEIFTNLPVVDNFNITENRYIPQLHKWDDETLYVDCDAFKSLYIDLKGVYKHKQYLLVEREKVNEVLFQYVDKFSSNIPMYDFMVFGSFTGDWYHYKKKEFREPASTEGYLVFESLSDNYLAYIRDAIYFMQIKESTDMSSIYLRDNIYTNIVGGLGLFAASSRQIQQCANIFKTGVVEDNFSKYGIIEEDGECRFADHESYEYPIYKPEE